MARWRLFSSPFSRKSPTSLRVPQGVYLSDISFSWWRRWKLWCEIEMGWCYHRHFVTSEPTHWCFVHTVDLRSAAMYPFFGVYLVCESAQTSDERLFFNKVCLKSPCCSKHRDEDNPYPPLHWATLSVFHSGAREPKRREKELFTPNLVRQAQKSFGG